MSQKNNLSESTNTLQSPIMKKNIKQLNDNAYNFRGERGVQIVIDYLTKRGYKCDNVQRNHKVKGCDIIAHKNNKTYKIEVKTTQKPKGISDCYISEFDDKNKFISDFLYVVRLNDDLTLKKVEVLTKDEINSYEHKKIEKSRQRNTTLILMCFSSTSLLSSRICLRLWVR